MGMTTAIAIFPPEDKLPEELELPPERPSDDGVAEEAELEEAVVEDGGWYEEVGVGAVE